MATIIVDPITRIEGHLKAEVTKDGSGPNANVTDAKVSGTMARGIEALLKGKDPRDAPYVTERICGVCFGAHGWTSCRAVETAHGATLPEAARLLRNLLVGACWLHDHVLHFYHLSALDYLDLSVLTGYTGDDPDLLKIKQLISDGDAGPLLPRYKPGDEDAFIIKDLGLVAHCVQSYLKALEMQIKAKRMSALFSGKQPHQSGMIVGGVTELPSQSKRDTFRYMLDEQIDFINNVYKADIVALAVGDPPGSGPLYPAAISEHGVGHQNYLAYGGFPEADGSFMYPEGAIVNGVLVASDRATIEAALYEDVTSSHYTSDSGGHPSTSEQNFKLDTGHSFVKAPRFTHEGVKYPMEVGPLARMMVAINRPSHPAHSHPATQYLIKLVTDYGVKPGTVARHGARCLETLILCDRMKAWLDELEALIGGGGHHGGMGGDAKIHDANAWDPPDSAQAYGMTEAPRGALAHWVKIENKVIDRYACVVPTTWNASPTDGQTPPKKGPYEQALMSLSGMATQLNIVRVIRAFDPCIACAVHLIRPNGDVEKFTIDI